MIAESVRACCSITHLIVEPLLNAILISAVIDVRQLGICLSYHRHPHASHHCDSYNFIVSIMSFFFQNRNMESPTNRLISFCLYMVSWHCNHFIQYVLCPQLCASCSHFPCLHLRRYDYGTAILHDSSLLLELLESHTHNKR